MAMAAKKKQAKFFCEYCDSEVPFNARFCPKCGHFFLAVRCPACGKTGDQDEFTNGCPQCGYAFNGEPVKSTVTKTPDSEKSTSSSRKIFFPKRAIRKYSDTTFSGKKRSDDALPPWIYIATLSGFVVVLFILVMLLKK
jgi:predicted amidophosphoribosyltransferase